MQPSETLIQLRKIASSLRSRCILLHSLDASFRLLQLAHDKREVSSKRQFQRIVQGQMGDEFGRICICWWCWYRGLFRRLFTMFADC